MKGSWEIRPAVESDARRLTEISFTSKAHWDYPPEFFTVWAGELTISPQYIAVNDVFVFVQKTVIIGYCSFVELQTDVYCGEVHLSAGFWLEHMFIDPNFLGLGIGRALFNHLRKVCRQKGITQFNILADPHARNFYEKMGAKYQLDFPSSVPGRTTPQLLYQVSSSSVT